MRMPSGVVDQVIFFVALDSTDLKTRETGLTTFTVYRSRNGGTATAMTTPTVAELSSANMPGVYSLLLDEDMTIDSGDDSQEMVFHITQASMAPVTRAIELYRPKLTVGNTLDVSAGGEAGLDWANIGSPTTAQNLSGTNIDPDQVVASVSGAVGSVTGAVGSVTGLTAATVHSDLDDIQTRLPAALVSGRIDSSVGAMAANVMTAAAAAADLTIELQSGLATAAALTVVDGIVDDILVDTSTTLQGELDGIQARLSPIDTLIGAVITDGGNSATSFKTDLTAPATDHYKDAFLKITSGALENQLREITGSTGTIDAVLTVAALTATPADGVTFEIVND